MSFYDAFKTFAPGFVSRVQIKDSIDKDKNWFDGLLIRPSSRTTKGKELKLHIEELTEKLLDVNKYLTQDKWDKRNFSPTIFGLGTYFWSS